MLLIEYRNKIYAARGESSGNSALTPAQIDEVINNQLNLISSARFWKYGEKVELITVPYTTVSTTSTGTTLYATSVSGLGKDRVICVTDGTNFEYPTIQSISGLTVTLKSPGLTESYVAGNYITLDKLFLPDDISMIISFRRGKISDSYKMRVHPIRLGDYAYPRRNERNEPTAVFLLGMSEDAQTGTTEDTTNSTQITCSALPASAIDNYFKNWLVINNTCKLHARVATYTQSTKVLTLKSAIAGQVKGDSFTLVPYLYQFILNPIPTEEETIQVRYLSLPKKLVADYDRPNFPERWDSVIYYGAMAELYDMDSNNPNAPLLAEKNRKLYHYWKSEMADSEPFLSQDEVESYHYLEDYSDDEDLTDA